jgi:uncharacterized protein YbjT (DUF2867 family)
MARYVILGGSGKVGRRLVEAMSADGQLAVPASRHSAVRFDWHDESSWAAALAGAAGVFIVGPGSAQDWSPGLTRFLEVADSAGVEHAVLLSARGAEFLPDGAVARAEHALIEGPVPWTILAPTHFSQNFTEAMFAPVEGIITAPVGDGAEPFIDAGNIADVAARVLVDHSFLSRRLELSGPAALRFDEAASILSAVTKQQVRFIPEDPQTHARRLREGGTPSGYITWRLAMLEGIRTGADAYISDGVQHVLGRPATSFEAWAAREARRLEPVLDGSTT